MPAPWAAANHAVNWRTGSASTSSTRSGCEGSVTRRRGPDRQLRGVILKLWAIVFASDALVPYTYMK
jgi:hypothetical protein